MKSKFVLSLVLSTLMSSSVLAGLPEAVKAFNEGNYESAYPEMMALSEEGDPVASFYMGRMTNEGLGTDADSTKAIPYFQRADEANYSDATVQLGLMAMNGEGMEKDENLAIDYLKKAAYAGNANALYELGNIYTDGTGVEPNLTYAFGFYYMSALKGDKRAQVKTAKHYLSGRGIPQDFNKAVVWYIRAANQGYVPAQQEWAELRSSHPRLMNPLDAYSWYSILAAYNTDEVGQEAAARRDEIGSGFDSETLAVQQQKIMKWRPVSAAASVPAAEAQNAVLPVIPGFNDSDTVKSRLESGKSLAVDGSDYGVYASMIETALKSGDKVPLEQAITAAAEHKKIKAYGFYGDILRTRFNDDASATSWYRQGADAGDPYAQYQLGKSYCEGRGGIAPDVGQCYGWLLMAQQKADPTLRVTIKNAIESVEKAATPEELQRGKDFITAQEQKATEGDGTKASTGASNNLFNLF